MIFCNLVSKLYSFFTPVLTFFLWQVSRCHPLIKSDLFRIKTGGPKTFINCCGFVRFFFEGWSLVSCNFIFRYKWSSKQAKEPEHFSFLGATVEYRTCSFTMSPLVLESAAAIVGAQLAEQLHPKAGNKMTEHTGEQPARIFLFYGHGWKGEGLTNIWFWFTPFWSRHWPILVLKWNQTLFLFWFWQPQTPSVNAKQ